MSVFTAANVVVEERTGGEFKLIPVDDYNFEIVAAEERIKDGKKYINLQLIITDGEFKDRRVFHSLFLDGYSPKANQIAAEMLKKICDANSVGSLEAWTDLEGMGFRARTKHEEYNGKTDAKIHFMCDEQVKYRAVPAREFVQAAFTPPDEEESPF